MKNVAFLALILALSLSSCYFDGWGTGISGNGDVVEESRNVDGFTGVEVSTGIDAYLTQDLPSRWWLRQTKTFRR